MSDLSRAVVLYVGWGEGLNPDEDPSRVIDEFGRYKGTALAGQARSIVEELREIRPAQGDDDLAGASTMAVNRIASRHPTLDSDARSALEWLYSWWWR